MTNLSNILYYLLNMANNDLDYLIADISRKLLLIAGNNRLSKKNKDLVDEILAEDIPLLAKLIVQYKQKDKTKKVRDINADK